MNTEALKQTIELCHEHNIAVIVDEAHGSHLKFLNLTDYQGFIFFF
jgi:seryl-tRNA(Sec) selenium transferase